MRKVMKRLNIAWAHALFAILNKTIFSVTYQRKLWTCIVKILLKLNTKESNSKLRRKLCFKTLYFKTIRPRDHGSCQHYSRFISLWNNRRKGAFRMERFGCLFSKTFCFIFSWKIRLVLERINVSHNRSLN